MGERIKALVVNNGNSLNNGVMAMAMAFAGYMTGKPGWKREDVAIHLKTPHAAKERARWGKVGLRAAETAPVDWLFRARQLPLVWRFIDLNIIQLRIVLMLLSVSALWPAGVKRWFFGCFFDAESYVSLLGEDFLSDNCPEYIRLYHYVTFRLAQKFGKPYYALGQTMGPFKTASSKKYCRRVLPEIELICCRDAESVHNVREFTQVNVCRVGDLAFLLKKDAGIMGDPDHPELRALPEKFVAVSVSRLFAGTVARINPAFPAAEDFCRATAESLDFIGGLYNAPIVFISHVIWPESWGDDRLAAEDVAKYMTSKPVILKDEYLASELKGIIAASQLFVGCRMHALVAATSTATPTIALAYSPKTIGVIGEELDYPFVIDLRSAARDEYSGKMRAFAVEINENPDRVIEKLNVNIPRVQKNSELNFVKFVNSSVCGESGGSV